MKITILPLVLLCLPALQAETVVDLLQQKTLQNIAEIDRKLDGVLGVAAIDLTTGQTMHYHGDVVFPQASSIKIPILIRMFRAARAGEFSLNDQITLTSKDKVGGSGHLQQALAKGPVTLSIRELVTAMIETSDNTATNRCIAMVKMERVNRMLDEMGFLNTRLRRIMMDTAAAGRDEENVSTPNEMARLVEKIYRKEAAHEEDCNEMLAIMKRVKASLHKAVPPRVEVASKPGGVPGVKCETGIVYLPNRPFVLSVMSTFVRPSATPVEDVTRVVYAHFERLAQSNKFGNQWR
jgi:Beta-lactamase class A